MFRLHGPFSRKGFEHLLAGTANRAAPLIIQVFETCALRHFPFPVAPVRIVKTPTVDCLALIYFFRFGHAHCPFTYQKQLMADIKAYHDLYVRIDEFSNPFLDFVTHALHER